jgi:LysM repeat protein
VKRLLLATAALGAAAGAFSMSNQHTSSTLGPTSEQPLQSAHIEAVDAAKVEPLAADRPFAHLSASALTTHLAGKRTTPVAHVTVTATRRPVVAVPRPTVIVASGDSLSAIAARHGLTWTQLGAYNNLPNPNLIEPGQVLGIPPSNYVVPASYGLARAESAGTPVQTPSTASTRWSRASSSGSSSGYSPRSTTVSSAGSGFQACVIARESGGNAQVMSGGGYYGLYQFAPSTWAAYGGNPADFGHAGAGEQNQVFANAMARGGQSNWSPYDGC